MTDRTDITGTVTDIDGHPNLVLTRTFAARPVVVWRALTESAQLEKWIGGWEGDPTTGQIMFFMTAEADDPVPVEYTILECDPPRRFVGDTAAEAGAWHLWFELVPRGEMHPAHLRSAPEPRRGRRLGRARAGSTTSTG